MKESYLKHLLTVIVSTAFLFGGCHAQEKLELKDQNDRTSYSVGYQIGGDFRRQGVQLNPEALVRGIKDAISDGKPLMTQQDMGQLLVDLKRRIVADQQEELKKAAEKNLASGLQYKVVKEGAGRSPKATDKVMVPPPK